MNPTAPLPAAPAARRNVKPRRTKLIVGVGSLVLGIFVIAVEIFAAGHDKPPTAAVREIAAAALKGQPLAIVKFDRGYKGDADSGQTIFVGEVATTAPLYVRVDTAAYLRTDLGVDVAALQADLALLKTRLGPRVAERVGSAPPTVALTDLVLVRQPVRVGTRFRLNGSARALRIGSLWQFDVVSVQVTPALPAGEQRPAGAAVYDVSDVAELGRLRQLVAAHVAYAAKIKAARPQLEAEIQKDRQERAALFAQLLRPGGLWVGRAVSAQNETHKLVLETTECSAKSNTLTAVLRNDGGWTDARSFTGEWNLDADAERCRVTLQTKATQRIEGAGPLLEANDTWAIDGDITAAGVLTARSPRWQFQFERVAEAEQAQTRTALMEPLTRALAATSPRTLYHGTAISKRTHLTEPVLLQFEEQDADGSLVTASLQAASRAGGKRHFQGTIIASRFRTGDAPVRLRSEANERAGGAARESVLGISERLAVAFKLDGNQLLGEDDTFTFRLERADAAWLASDEAARAARSRRFLALVKPGAAYDGVARDDRGMVGRLRFRVLEVDAPNNIVSVAFDSREQHSVYHRMSGSFDVGSGRLQLGSSGAAKSDPTGMLRVPIFTSTAAQRVTLQLEDEAVTGTIENQGWSLTFTLLPTGPVLAEADLPTSPGAYVLADGRWQTLPRNNGHTVYAAAQVLNGVLNALHAFDSRIPGQQADNADQAATLVFDGNLAAPGVSRDAVVIAFVGEIVPPAPALRQKYVELRDYPLMEMARTQLTRDGKRQAPLLRIAPGFSGFGNTRIAAALEQPRVATTLLRSTGPLDPGTYAVACGSATYEVEVR